MKKNIVVLFGGCSSEYGVSLQSAAGVLAHMDRENFRPIPVGISAGGDWFRFTGGLSKITNNTWLNAADCAPAALSPNRSVHELLIFGSEGVEHLPIDAVFPVLHGRNGEDGTVQGACELAGIPVVGCGTLASALGMDKDRAHKLAALAGVRVPKSFVLRRGSRADSVWEQAAAIGYPLFVKPVRAGSSYGVTKVMKGEQLAGAITAAFRYDDMVLAEECIPGFEVGCAVMGNSALLTGEIDEIELADGFFNFTEKYHLITSRIHVPARIPSEKSDELKKAAEAVYRALGCRGFARVDLFLTPEGGIVFNEVNTIPGFTPHSRFPNMMKAAGIPFDEVVTRAIELAVGK